MTDTCFNSAMEVVFKHEGGYVNHPNDPGGETNYGITKRSYPELDIKNLTKEQAKTIYYTDYWKKFGFDRIEDCKIATKVFDMGVNMGGHTAIKLLQSALGLINQEVTVDGLIGPQTLGAIEESNRILLRDALCLKAKERYIHLMARNSRLLSFRRGWYNRAEF